MAEISNRLYRLPAVLERFGISRSWVYAQLANPGSDFPRPIKLSRRAIAFRDSDLSAWEAGRPRSGDEVPVNCARAVK